MYGPLWVTWAWVVRHPDGHTLALPLAADLSIRQHDLAQIGAARRPDFATQLAFAAAPLAWIAPLRRGPDKPLWFAVDGAYARRPVLKAARAAGASVVSRVRKGAALDDLPPVVPKDQRGPGRPRTYGTHRLRLAKRAGHRQGWQQGECFPYQAGVTKTVKPFLATWRPAGGVIRAVLVKEADGCVRPSHADRRKALQREMLADEFWRRWGARPWPVEIQELMEVLLGMVA